LTGHGESTILEATTTEEGAPLMKRLITALSLSLSATVSVAAFAANAKTAAPAAAPQQELAPQVSLDELKTLVQGKTATILDANGTDMYDAGHVPGAISYTKNEGKLASLLPKDKGALLVAYCGGPMCTAWEFAAKEAMKLGYTNIKHFKGGIKGWKDAGLAVEPGVKKAS
jgi:rhodanese-related sulfurtransferase